MAHFKLVPVLHAQHALLGSFRHATGRLAYTDIGTWSVNMIIERSQAAHQCLHCTLCRELQGLGATMLRSSSVIEISNSLFDSTEPNGAWVAGC